jgi:hypothetical protein
MDPVFLSRRRRLLINLVRRIFSVRSMRLQACRTLTVAAYVPLGPNQPAIQAHFIARSRRRRATIQVPRAAIPVRLVCKSRRRRAPGRFRLAILAGRGSRSMDSQGSAPKVLVTVLSATECLAKLDRLRAVRPSLVATVASMPYFTTIRRSNSF